MIVLNQRSTTPSVLLLTKNSGIELYVSFRAQTERVKSIKVYSTCETGKSRQIKINAMQIRYRHRG